MPSELILTQDGTNPPAPAANEVTLFAKAGSMYAIGNAGTVKELSFVNDLVMLEYNVASGVNGGSAAAAVWETRPINTVDVNPNGICTLNTSTNQFVLLSGTYEYQIVTTQHQINRVRIRLFNVTDSVAIKTSVTAHLTTGVGTPITLMGYFTIGAAKSLSIQQYSQTALAALGMGIAGNAPGVNEIFLQAMFRRISL